MLHIQIKDFLLHGPLEVPLKTQGVDEGRNPANVIHSFECSNNNNERLFISNVQDSIRRLKAMHQVIISEQNNMAAQIRAYHAQANEQQQILLQADIAPRLNQYRQTDLTMSLMDMAAAVQALSDLEVHIENDVEECELQHIHRVTRDRAIYAIPALVYDIFTKVPLKSQTLTALPRSSRLFVLLLDTVSRLKSRMLQQFISQFENLLSNKYDEPNASNANSEASLSSSKSFSTSSTSLWQQFLKTSRNWLLAFCMLSILPVSLSETPQAVQDAYVRAVDEVLAPLWGRFRFHLKQSTGADLRKTGNRPESGDVGYVSKRQVLWTFQYCRSFARLLLDLCSQITLPNPESTAEPMPKASTRTSSADGAVCLADLLRELPSIVGPPPQQIDIASLRMASQKFLLTKCVNFFQAHLAEVLVTLTPLDAASVLKSAATVEPLSKSDMFILNLVEHSLSLDSDLGKLLLGQEQDSAEITGAAASLDKSGVDVSASHVPLQHTCIEVICAAKPVLTQWMKADLSYVSKAVAGIFALGDAGTSPSISDLQLRLVFRRGGHFGVLFSCAFRRPRSVLDEYRGYGDTISDGELFERRKSDSINPAIRAHAASGRELFCYKGPYEIMQLFMLVSKRYSMLSSTTGAIVQAQFATSILEPLLHLLISLLLLRIRSSAVLCDLGDGVMPLDMRRHLLVSENEAVIRNNWRQAAREQSTAKTVSDEDTDVNPTGKHQGDIIPDATATSLSSKVSASAVNGKNYILNAETNDQTRGQYSDSLPVPAAAMVTSSNRPERDLTFSSCPHMIGALRELQQFYDSVEYLEQALANCNELIRAMRCAALDFTDKPSLFHGGKAGNPSTTYEIHWEAIHAWLPRDLLPMMSTRHDERDSEISEAAASLQKDLLQQLLKRLFSGEASEVLRSATTGSRTAFPSGASADKTTLGLSIDMCRAQMATLVQVLRKQESKALRKLGYSH